MDADLSPLPKPTLHSSCQVGPQVFSGLWSVCVLGGCAWSYLCCSKPSLVSPGGIHPSYVLDFPEDSRSVLLSGPALLPASPHPHAQPLVLMCPALLSGPSLFPVHSLALALPPFCCPILSWFPDPALGKSSQFERVEGASGGLPR